MFPHIRRRRRERRPRTPPGAPSTTPSTSSAPTGMPTPTPGTTGARISPWRRPSPPGPCSSGASATSWATRCSTSATACSPCACIGPHNQAVTRGADWAWPAKADTATSPLSLALLKGSGGSKIGGVAQRQRPRPALHPGGPPGGGRPRHLASQRLRLRFREHAPARRQEPGHRARAGGVPDRQAGPGPGQRGVERFRAGRPHRRQPRLHHPALRQPGRGVPRFLGARARQSPWPARPARWQPATCCGCSPAIPPPSPSAPTGPRPSASPCRREMAEPGAAAPGDGAFREPHRRRRGRAGRDPRRRRPRSRGPADALERRGQARSLRDLHRGHLRLRPRRRRGRLRAGLPRERAADRLEGCAGSQGLPGIPPALRPQRPLRGHHVPLRQRRSHAPGPGGPRPRRPSRHPLLRRQCRACHRLPRRLPQGLALPARGAPGRRLHLWQQPVSGNRHPQHAPRGRPGREAGRARGLAGRPHLRRGQRRPQAGRDRAPPRPRSGTPASWPPTSRIGPSPWAGSAWIPPAIPISTSPSPTWTGTQTWSSWPRAAPAASTPGPWPRPNPPAASTG